MQHSDADITQHIFAQQIKGLYKNHIIIACGINLKFNFIMQKQSLEAM